MYCNLPKIGPPPILNVVAAEGAFLSKLRPPAHCSTCGYVRSSTVQEEEQTKWRQTPFAYVRKHIRGIAKSPHAYINRARLSSVCEVDIFSRNSTTLENTPTILFTEHLAPRLCGRRATFFSSHAAWVRGYWLVVDTGKQLSEWSSQTKQYSLQKILLPKMSLTCKTTRQK